MKAYLKLCGVLAGASMLAASASAQPSQDLQIPISSVSFATAPARIAKEMGLFEKRGINARIVTMDSANASISALISGAVDVTVAGPGELIAANARGQKLVIVANMYDGLSASLVLSKATVDKFGIKADAPVAARLKALDGLVIGTPSATSSYTVSFKTAAADLGANIRFTYMAQPAMVAALESGAIQGYIAGAPFWGTPVVKGTGVLWLSGPKRELPSASLPASSVSLQALRSVADAKPVLMKNLAAVFDDLSDAVRNRPQDVKAALGKLYPDVDAATLDLLFRLESPAWMARKLTAADMKHEIAFVKANGAPLPNIDAVDPASMLYP